MADEAKLETPKVEVEAPKPAPKPVKKYPAKIRMVRPFGFIDNTGNHYWPQGFIEDVPEQIQLIIDHGCKDYVVV